MECDKQTDILPFKASQTVTAFGHNIFGHLEHDRGPGNLLVHNLGHHHDFYKGDICLHPEAAYASKVLQLKFKESEE